MRNKMWIHPFLLPRFSHVVGWLGTTRNFSMSTTLQQDSDMGDALELFMKPIFFKSQFLAPSNLYLQIQCDSVILLICKSSVIQ